MAFTESTGYSAEEAIGRKTAILNPGRHDNAFYEAFWPRSGEEELLAGRDLEPPRKTGSIIHAEWLTSTASYRRPAGDALRRRLLRRGGRGRSAIVTAR